MLDERHAGASRSRSRGETVDTLAAMDEAREQGATMVAIVQRRRAARPRASADGAIYLHAGPEIGVASTKAFAAQLIARYLLALHLGQVRGTLSRTQARRARSQALVAAAGAVERGARAERAIEEMAERYCDATRLPLPGPRHQLPDRARRRAEAQGDLLHPRRGLPRRRDEARPDRADRRGHAGGGDRAAATQRYEKMLSEHRAGQGARRQVIAIVDRGRP